MSASRAARVAESTVRPAEAGAGPGPAYRHLGTPALRREDLRLLTGRGRFMEDLSPLPNIHAAAILRSPHAHALIRRIDTRRAERMPGVLGVLTGRDVAALSRPFPNSVRAEVPYYPCAVDRARFVGEPVAVVVARDRYVAEDALAAIEVEYQPLPAVVDIEAATADGASLLHEAQGSNVAHRREFRYGDPDAAFASADLVVSGRFHFPKVSSTPIETYGVIAHFDPADGVLTVWSNFHGPFTLHAVLAAALGLPPNRLRLIVPPDIGGSFGIKAGIYPYLALMGLASRKFGVAVRWTEDRMEHLAASSSGADRITDAAAAVRRDGKILALRLRYLDNVGAYLRAPEPACLYRTHGNTTGPYDIKHVALETCAVLTNKCPTGLNRGYGGPPMYFALERLIDRVAEATGLDPAEVRRVNLLGQHRFPFETPTGGLYDSGDYPAALARAMELVEYDQMRAWQRSARAEGRLIGVGLALAVEPSGSNMGYITLGQTPEERARGLPKSGCTEAVTIACDASGGIIVRLGTTPQGQGHETVAAQIVADELGVPPESVQVVAEMDTFNRAWTISSGSYSSRFGPLGASALAMAARRLRDRMAAVAATLLGVSRDEVERRGDQFVWKPDPTRAVSLRRIAGTVHWNPQALPADQEPSLEVTVHYALPVAGPPDALDRVDSSATYGFVADAAVVEVHAETGRVEILRYVSVHDAGRLLNPLLAEGQISGGAVHGLGAALFEELRYDRNGQFLTATFMDYLCPTAMEAPTIEIAHIQTPSPLTELGAKGLGEGSTMTAPALIGNAVADALRHLGVSVDRLPLTPARVWEWLQGRQEGRT